MVICSVCQSGIRRRYSFRSFVSCAVIVAGGTIVVIWSIGATSRSVSKSGCVWSFTR